MKKQKITVLVVAVGLFLAASFSFYKLYANASERTEQEIVSSIIVDAAKQDHLSKNDLLAATHIDKIENVTKVVIPKKAFMEKLVPGTYEVAIKLEMDFKKSLDKQVTVKVVDSEGPVIQVKSPVELEQGQSLDKEKYFTAEDKVSGKIPAEQITITGLDTKLVGKQQVKLTAKDAYDNETSKDIEVVVKEAPKAEVVSDPVEAAAEVAAPVAEAPVTTPEPAAETEIPETAPQPATIKEEAPAPAAAVTPQVMTNTLSFAGTTVSYTQANGSGAAPGSGATTWMGNGSTTDGAPTHFIGHNPGDFSGVMNLGVGSQITVTDGNGASRTYTVYEVMDVTDDGYNNHNLSDDVYPRMLYAGGERISLQTCITETVNRCVLAR